MHATFLEFVQTIAAALGSMLTARAMVSADLDLLALVRAGLNGNRKAVAEKNVRVERCVLVVQCILFLAGFASLWLPPPPYGYPDAPAAFNAALTRGSIITRLSLTIASVTLTYLSYRNWLDIRLPMRAARRATDAGVAALAVVAQEAASAAQATATVAQGTATIAQDVATEAQRAADTEGFHD